LDMIYACQGFRFRVNLKGLRKALPARLAWRGVAAGGRGHLGTGGAVVSLPAVYDGIRLVYLAGVAAIALLLSRTPASFGPDD